MDNKVDQKKFFAGLGFEETVFKYECGSYICYKGTDGAYYRIDHFGQCYVIESAENQNEARSNLFEDSDLFDDKMPEEDLVAAIQNTLKSYVGNKKK